MVKLRLYIISDTESQGYQSNVLPMIYEQFVVLGGQKLEIQLIVQDGPPSPPG